MTPLSPVLRAGLWMTGAIGSFSTMAVAGRELSDTLDTFEIMTYRSVIGIVIVCTWLTLFRKWEKVRARRMGLHLVRNTAHFIGQNLWFFAVTATPLALVFALEFTSPLWVIVLAPLLLGETMTRSRALAAALGFVGILIVTRPGATALTPGLIAAASCAVFFALTTLFTKQLTRSESIASILFWLTVMQAILGLSASFHDGDMAWPDAAAWPLVIVVGMAGLLAHFCITSALSIAPASVVVPFDFIRLPTIAIVGWALYSEPLDLWILVGAAVIFAANYMNVLRESRHAA